MFLFTESSLCRSYEQNARICNFRFWSILEARPNRRSKGSIVSNWFGTNDRRMAWIAVGWGWRWSGKHFSTPNRLSWFTFKIFSPWNRNWLRTISTRIDCSTTIHSNGFESIYQPVPKSLVASILRFILLILSTKNNNKPVSTVLLFGQSSRTWSQVQNTDRYDVLCRT